LPRGIRVVSRNIKQVIDLRKLAGIGQNVIQRLQSNNWFGGKSLSELA
jgi:hypothetical protein